MNGQGAIVMRIRATGDGDNGYRYFEHESIREAKAEAHRLCLSALPNERMVVYVPVAVVTRTPPTTESVPVIAQGDESLPF